MSSSLMLGSAQKAAGDRVRVPCDWGNEPMLQPEEDRPPYVITSYDVTVAGTGAPVVSGKQLDYPYQTSAIFAGGSVGIYDVTFTITLNDPDATVLSRVGSLEVVA